VAPTPVLYVHHREDLGGAPRSLAGLIAHLDRRWEPHVYVPEGRSAELFASVGARVHTGPVAMFGHSWDNPYAGVRWLLLGREAARLPGHVVAFERLLRSRRFPIVHLNEAQLLPAAAMAKRSGAHVVWHLRSSLATSGPRRRRLVTRAIDRWGDAAIAIDEDVAASFPVRLPVHVVFNSVDLPEIVPSPAAARDRMVVGWIGHLRRVKGWEDLIRAVADLRDERVELVIVGGGVRPPAYFTTPQGRVIAALGLLEDEETAARSLVADLGLDDRVTFMPYTADLGSVYQALDVVAFPNRGAGLGRPVLEAAAYGIPAVASGSPAGGGVLAPGETGLVVRQGDPPELARALRELARDAALRERLGDRARRRAAERFEPRASADAVSRLYARLLGAATVF
jgi:glycosyltransferase involved in cell wall biosynthesis